MSSTKTKHPAQIGFACAFAVALGGCELRNTDPADETPIVEDPAAVEPIAGDTPAEPEPTDTSTAVASIIRDDVEPVRQAEVPAKPVALTIPFPDGANLSIRGERLLAGVLDSRAMAEGWPIIIGGHTDSSGNDQANLRASRSRAEAVAAWLVERGVADERIEVVAFGEQNPLAPNALPDGSPNEEGRRTNRRVELRIAPAPPHRPAIRQQRRARRRSARALDAGAALVADAG